MEKLKMQFNFRSVEFIAPIVLYFLFVGILSLGSALSAKFYFMNTMDTLVVITFYLTIPSLLCSYLFSHLYTKNKKWGCWEFILYIGAIILYIYLLSKSWGLVLWVLCFNLRPLALGVLLYMSYDWFRKVRRQKELEKQNLQSELKLLKNQLNPHFLFNTLNNIDSLIRSDPEKASKSLVQISDIMRYMIYETNVSEVYFSQELSYIKNYLALQRLQYDNPELVSYVLEGEAGDICIAPMLFIPFIENAFKHCTDKKAKEAICFHFQIQGSEIQFTASNLYDPLKCMNKDSSTGIGLSTVKRRLDFLYSGRYNLKINEEKGYFCVSLKIKLI